MPMKFFVSMMAEGLHPMQYRKHEISIFSSISIFLRLIHFACCIKYLHTFSLLPKTFLIHLAFVRVGGCHVPEHARSGKQ